MEYLVVSGGRKLNGNVLVSGAKNATLPILTATILSRNTSIVRNIPNLEDVTALLQILERIGCITEVSGKNVGVACPKIKSCTAPYHLVKSLRASFWVLAPLLARYGEARVALPGGDSIGSRPVDIHLKGLTAMGADIRFQHGVVTATANQGLKPTDFSLEFPSVGATHQLLMAAAATNGKTILRNVAREPEVIELANFLSSMGANISGAGEELIEIEGCEELGNGDITIGGDRIEAITYLAAAAVTGGKVTVQGLAPEKLSGIIGLLTDAGHQVLTTDNSITLVSGGRSKALSFRTEPFPGIATDAQPILMAMLTLADGISDIEETIFEARYHHVSEYRRLGADIKIDGRNAIITGVQKISGAEVDAYDIRAAAGLVIMALAAEGETVINELHHLNRGYENLLGKFKSLGAELNISAVSGMEEVSYGC